MLIKGNFNITIFFFSTKKIKINKNFFLDHSNILKRHPVSTSLSLITDPKQAAVVKNPPY
jgi:hypothetical protein